MSPTERALGASRGWRPREGWRIFAGEVGIIVVGVLLALGAQEVADQWRWSKDVARTKADLDSEILGNVVLSAERVAISQCLRGRIAELRDALVATDGSWKAMPFRGLVDTNPNARVMPVVYRAPSRVWTTDVWEQAKDKGLFNHMKAEELTRYSGVYEQLRGLRTENSDEQTLQAQLAGLGFDGAIDPTLRSQALSTLAQLDARNHLIVLVAGQLAVVASRLEGRLSRAQLAELGGYITSQRAFRGVCVDEAAARKLLAPLMPGKPVATGPQ